MEAGPVFGLDGAAEVQIARERPGHVGSGQAAGVEHRIAVVHQVVEGTHQAVRAQCLEFLLVKLGQVGGAVPEEHLFLHRGHDVGRAAGEEGLPFHVDAGEHLLEAVVVGYGVVDEMPQKFEGFVQAGLIT